MNSLDAVLNELRAFLAGELTLHCRLPPHVEERRQVLLEYLDLLTFGPCPPSPPPPPPPPLHFSLSVSPQTLMLERQRNVKRHSLPIIAASSSLPPHSLHFCESAPGPVDHTPSPSNTSDYATPCGGPSRRISLEAAVRTTQPDNAIKSSTPNATSPLYEEPVSFIQRFSTIQTSQEESISEWSPDHQQLNHPSVHAQNRLSLSSQFESSTSSTSLSYHFQTPSIPVSGGSPTPSIHPLVLEGPIADTTDLGTLMLPKKSLSSSRRGAASLYTLAGALYHRYKPGKWTRLGYCILTPDAHLLGFRSSTNQSSSPAVSLFVATASTVAVYAGRESGMQNVFKVTHSGNGGDAELPAVASHGGGGRALVFAADCEEEALAWINQINHYAQGTTPGRVESFTNHFCRRKSSSTHRQNRRRPSNIGSDVISLSDFSQAASNAAAGPSSRRKSVVVLGDSSGRGIESQSTRPHSLFLPHLNTSLTLAEAQQKIRPIPLPTPKWFEANQEDSGFSGLISSSSSATDGTNGEVTEQRAYPSTTSPNSIILRHQRYSVASTKSSISTSDLFQSRASGLFSSVRRKVADSLNLPKRRSLVLPPRTTEMSGFSQSPASPQVTRDSGLVGWTQLDAVLGHDAGIHLSRDGSMSSLRTRSWRGVRGKQHQQVKLISASPLNSSLTPNTADSVLTGDIFISIPGRLSWTRRWCALRSSNLEIHASALSSSSQSSSGILATSLHRPPLLLSLPLQPGVVEVSPASDKRHPSAVRLSAPALSPHPLLIDAGDTVVMGRWIRGIIEALGHIRSNRAPTIATPSNRRSEITSPPHLEPIYDEVASITNSANFSKRWTWTSLPAAYRSVVMEVTPLPTLPSAGPSSPTDSSINGGNTVGGGAICSSVYYDSVVPVDEEDSDEEGGNDTCGIRRHPSSLHSRTSHDMLSRSFSSLRMASTSDDSTDYSNSLLGNREYLCGGLRLRRYRSLDWHFTARRLQETNWPVTPCCSFGDKIASFLLKGSVDTPTSEVAVARSYSCAVQGTINQAKAEIFSLHDPLPVVELQRKSMK